MVMDVDKKGALHMFLSLFLYHNKLGLNSIKKNRHYKKSVGLLCFVPLQQDFCILLTRLSIYRCYEVMTSLYDPIVCWDKITTLSHRILTRDRGNRDHLNG